MQRVSRAYNIDQMPGEQRRCSHDDWSEMLQSGTLGGRRKNQWAGKLQEAWGREVMMEWAGQGGGGGGVAGRDTGKVWFGVE